MKKKLIALALAALTLLTLAACGKSSKTLDLDKAAENIDATGVYANMITPDDEFMTSVVGLDMSKVEKSLVSIPLMNVKASLYFVVLPAKGGESDVKAALDEYMAVYENTWSQYLPDQAALVKDRLETEIETAEGAYYVYIISEDNDAVLAAINGALA